VSEVAGLKREIMMLKKLASAAVLVRRLGKATEEIAAAMDQHDASDALQYRSRSATPFVMADKAFDQALEHFDECAREVETFYRLRRDDFHISVKLNATIGEIAMLRPPPASRKPTD
jgi:hypothetical protein